MNLRMFRRLAVMALPAAVAAVAAWLWQTNRYEKEIALMTAAHARERQAAVDVVAQALQRAITNHQQLAERLAALDQTHYEEMQRATAENDHLQRALVAGDVRMSVRARCQPDSGGGPSADQPGASLGDGASVRCELSGEDAADLLDLFAGAQRDAEKLRYLQARERALETAGVCVQP